MSRPSPIWAFLPIWCGALAILGNLVGGVWAVAALVLVILSGLLTGPFPTGTERRWLPVFLGLMHFGVLYSAVLASRTWEWPGAVIPLSTTALVLAKVSNSAAHELIHSLKRIPSLLGTAVFSSHLFGHHNSAHRLVHHVHVGTDRDPNSARRSQGLYHFLGQAWFGSLRAAFFAERARNNAGVFWTYAGLTALTLTFSAAFAGLTGLATHIGLALYASVMLLASDYVQHYGLRRATLENGATEPVQPCHAWDAPPGLADGLMLNAPRHAHHHMRPMVPFDELTREQAANRLPYPLPVMIWLAFAPRIWRRIMDPRLDRIAAQARA